MISFTVCCQNSEIVELTHKVLLKEFGDDLEFDVEKRYDTILQHLYYESPQFVLFDLDDPEIRAHEVIQKLVKDPLLLNIRVLGFTTNTEENVLAFPGIFSIMNASQIRSLLPHIVHILSSNQQLLLQTGLIHKLGHKGTLTIDNNPILLEGYAELVASFLYSKNYIDMQAKYGLKFSLVEMLMNAVEHGNCNISYQEKSEWLEEGNDILLLIEEKCKDPEVAKKKVTLKYDIGDHETHFTIHDEGTGFDVSSLPDPEDVLAVMELHGRGIFMTRNYVKNLAYNDIGNEVTITIGHVDNLNREIPEGFVNSEVLEFQPGDIVFREHEKSNTLYYIVGGEFEVITANKVVTTLNNTSIFLGEMAFLLGNRRTATVRAKTKGHLVAINAMEWMDAIQKYPYYGIFLSRLLAKKLDDQAHPPL